MSDKKSGVLIYKCRRCGKLDKRTHVPSIEYALNAITVGFELPKEWGNITHIGMTDMCLCGDGNLGVSDLIGAEYDFE